MARKALNVGELGEVFVKNISKKPLKYRARVRVGCVDGVTRYVQADAPTRTAAKEKVTAAARRKVYGKKAPESTPNVLTGKSTVLELANAWIDSREVIHDLSSDVVQQTGQVRTQTLDKYRQLFSTLRGERGEWNLASMALEDVTTDNVSTWLELVSYRAPSTAKLCKIMLAGAFKMVMSKGVVAWNENPTAGAMLHKGVKREPQALTRRDETRAIELAEQWQTPRKFMDLVGIVKLLSGTGMRPAEALAVRWEDVDLSSTPATVKVTGIVIELKGGKGQGKGLVRQPVTKTRSGLRVNKLPAATTAMLMERWVNRESDLVFPNRSGGLTSLANVNRAWREARGEELKHVRLKDFRPTVATKIERTHGAKAAALQLGHGSTKITEEFYIEAGDAGDYTAALEL